MSRGYYQNEDGLPARPPQYREPSATPFFLWFIAFGSLLLAGGLLAWQLWPESRTDPLDPQAQEKEFEPPKPLRTEEQAVIDLYSEAKKSVVHISTSALRQDRFSFNVLRVPRGTGSGFVWNDQGHVVTNFHVVMPEGERPQDVRVQVSLDNGKTYRATIIGAYPDKDIAVLHLEMPKSEAEELPSLRVARSEDLQVGQNVYAIGNPFGLSQTLTRGIISALGREIETSKNRPPIRNVIQTDAAINPGNSGGPLLNSSGDLVGMCTAIYSPSGASAGIGFAVPSSEINRVVTQLIRDGRITKPSMGIEPANDQITRRVHPTGVMILSVHPDGPAEKAGLRGVHAGNLGYLPGDIILRLDDTPIHSVRDYLGYIAEKEPGKTVKVRFLREGEEAETEVILSAI